MPHGASQPSLKLRARPTPKPGYSGGSEGRKTPRNGISARRQCKYSRCRRFLRVRWSYPVDENGKRLKLRPQPHYCSSRCKGLATRGTGETYITIRVNGKRVYLHRYVMEQKLGRPLLPEEIVHHKDEDKHNNSDDNLELLTGDAKRKHLELHNYYRDWRKKYAKPTPDDCPF